MYSETPPRLLRRLGTFDVTPDPSVRELDVWLLAGETIRPDAARFFRSRPGAGRWQNPLAEKDGSPGVVFRWLEVEGPIYDRWPTAGHELLFGRLPLTSSARASVGVEVESVNPRTDAARLLADFLQRAYRRPTPAGEVRRFLPVVEHTLQAGGGFTDAMLAGYTAVLCSPEFLGGGKNRGGSTIMRWRRAWRSFCGTHRPTKNSAGSRRRGRCSNRRCCAHKPNGC